MFRREFIPAENEHSVTGSKEMPVGAKKKTNIPADKLELYEKLVRTNPKIERKGDLVAGLRRQRVDRPRDRRGCRRDHA